MATYNYKCTDCDNTFVIKASIQEKEEGKIKNFICPKCHSGNTKRKFSLTNFVKNIACNEDESGSCCKPKSKDSNGCC